MFYDVVNMYNFFNHLTSFFKSGMIPHKTKRGMEAMNRLKVFDGVPPPYDKVNIHEKMVHFRSKLFEVLLKAAFLL